MKDRFPQGWQQLGQSDRIQAGDVIVDCGGHARGPIPASWEGVGREVSDYTISRSGIGLPAAKGVFRIREISEIRGQNSSDQKQEHEGK